MSFHRGQAATHDAESCRSLGSDPDVLAIDRRKLVRLVAHMKVLELAQLAGISVEAIVSKVAARARLPVSPGMNGRRRGTKKHRARLPAPDEPEPELGRLFGRATRREIQQVVDRWVFGRVLAAHAGNITYAAWHLGISRRALRDGWARVSSAAVEARLAELRSAKPSDDDPAGPSLAAMLDHEATRREIHGTVNRWLVEQALAAKGGNVTHAAELVGIPRRVLREIRDSDAGRPSNGGNRRR